MAGEAYLPPKFEVNRRAIGASVLNRRLGAVGQRVAALKPLPEILAEALEEVKRKVA